VVSRSNGYVFVNGTVPLLELASQRDCNALSGDSLTSGACHNIGQTFWDLSDQQAGVSSPT
jgi:hypothetical protein